jgi:hypothetical protein
MHSLLQKIHMYLGLLCWSILFVYGIAGLTATVRSDSPGPQFQSSMVRTQSFVVAPNQTDKQVADAVWRTLRIPLTGPPSAYAIHRNNQNNLVVSLWTSNGPIDVTVLERQNQLRIETRRNSIWEYFNNLHAATVRDRPYDWRIKLWTYYNEFAIWALLLMALTGLLLWMTSRPRYWLAQVSVAIALVSFYVLYVLTR